MKNKLIHILKSMDNVEFAYLFGSYADGTFTDSSDVDVAIYLSVKDLDNRLAKCIRSMLSLISKTLSDIWMQHKIEAKINRIRYYIKLLEEYKEGCCERFVADPMF